MLRRQVQSYDDWARPEYGGASMLESSPRKWRSYQAAPLRQRTLARVMNGQHNLRGLWGQAYSYNPEHPWIGKQFIPWNGSAIVEYVQQTTGAVMDGSAISELEVARMTRPNIYRVLYAQYYQPAATDGTLMGEGEWIVVSRPSVEYRPNRLNLVLTPDNRVLAVFQG